jgi:hypothetical protein
MQELDELSARFWQWRAASQPRTRDDIPRLDRPADWLPDIGEATVLRRRVERDRFADELAAIGPSEVADMVEHRLLRSAIARVRWELDIAQLWHQPRFYTDQALGVVFDVLLRQDVDQARIVEVLRYLDNVPSVLQAAQTILPARAVAEFTQLAISELAGIEARLHHLGAALGALDPLQRPALNRACTAAAEAFIAYREWLISIAPNLPAAVPIGRASYEWFLREVACIPLSAAKIGDIGRLEFDRATVLELLSRRKHARVPQPLLPIDSAVQSRRQAHDERAVRAFYLRSGLLSQPEDLGHYLTAPMPDYLAALGFLGVADDLTSPLRLNEDGVSYFPEPAAELPYFYAANARDPRAGIVHEGAHYQQLALSWRHERPIRRHYYDSGANEGIAFYNEELMLAAGLFDDAPHSQTTMYNFMRLRALRVVLDVGLATGELSISAAAGLLAESVGMDADTADEEAAFFAETPGQALTYQIGKTQLLALIADAVRLRGDELDLQALHDEIWRNGNVPIALLRWEILGLVDELDAIGISL